ncbi:hypothetical protein FACS189472_02930 [Alphaproteobacteria bacterium]|nr:hypothetical protein FACS189472_02930 [Alphaproteobacteria bacterium]
MSELFGVPILEEHDELLCRDIPKDLRSGFEEISILNGTLDELRSHAGKALCSSGLVELEAVSVCEKLEKLPSSEAEDSLSRSCGFGV